MSYKRSSPMLWVLFLIGLALIAVVCASHHAGAPPLPGLGALFLFHRPCALHARRHAHGERRNLD